MNQQRILIKWKNDLFKLCGFSCLLDKKTEPYIKFVFPKTSDSYKVNKIDNDGITRRPQIDSNFYEFSYHYLSGIRHLKYSKERIDQVKNLPTISENQCIHLFSVTIHYFKSYQIQKNKMDRDFLISRQFELKDSRLFNFCLFYKTKPKFRTKDLNLIPIDTYSFPISKDLNLGIYDTVLKKCWCANIESMVSYHFFMYDNPIVGARLE